MMAPVVVTSTSPASAQRPVPGALRAIGYAAVAFGFATIVAGGLVLFGPDAARAAAGRAVPFVVWTNFLAGFAYVAAGIGLAGGQRWAVGLAAGIAAATALAALAFGAHALSGGAFEPRTAWALLLRTGLWAGVAVWARRYPRLLRHRV
jgi:hypothetical protein